MIDIPYIKSIVRKVETWVARNCVGAIPREQIAVLTALGNSVCDVQEQDTKATDMQDKAVRLAEALNYEWTGVGWVRNDTEVKATNVPKAAVTQEQIKRLALQTFQEALEADGSKAGPVSRLHLFCQLALSDEDFLSAAPYFRRVDEQLNALEAKHELLRLDFKNGMEHVLRDRNYWKESCAAMKRYSEGDVWMWEPDGDNNVATMAHDLPVVIRAEHLYAIMQKDVWRIGVGITKPMFDEHMASWATPQTRISGRDGSNEGYWEIGKERAHYMLQDLLKKCGLTTKATNE